MSYGMFALNPETYPTTLHTDVVNSLFYKNAGTYTYTGTIPSSNFLASFGIATPINPVTWQFTGYIYNRITVAGAVVSNGSSYQQPVYQMLTYNGYPGSEPYPTIVPAPAYVHSFGTLDTVSGYGFSVRGPSSLAIAPGNRAYCVHPTSTGDRLRTSTASSLSFPQWQYGAGTTSYTQPTGPNIIFDQPYDTPPLIFITSSSGPIAMNFMNRDGNGKYISASICAHGTLQGRNSWEGVGAYGQNTVSFTYFIVSDETPIYGNIADYGVRVFDSTGAKMYDSTNVMPNFVTISLPTPWMQLTWSGNSGSFQSFNGYTITKQLNQGVCINNFNPFVGYSEYISAYIGNQGNGPLTFFGRYISCTSTSVTQQGLGTGSFMRSYLGYSTSWEFTKAQVPNTNLLYGSYYI